jgi:Tol biopolymer transport system component
LACGPGDLLVYGGLAGPIMRVQAGGVPTPVTKLDALRGEIAHEGVFLLADGKHFTYRIRSTMPEHAGIAIGSLDGDPPKRLHGASQSRTFGGYLFFPRERALMAQKLDLRRLELTGEPFVVAQMGSTASISSEGGVLVFENRGGPVSSELVISDRAGKRVASFTHPESSGGFGHVEFSSDGRRLITDGAAGGGNRKQDLWTVDVARGVPARLTFDAETGPPTWSPDGRYIYYSDGKRIVRIPSTGTGPPEPVAEGVGHHLQLSPDGAYAVFDTGIPESSLVMTVALNGSSKPRAIVDFSAADPRFSPDGKWLAYSRLAAGQRVIFVDSWPSGRGKYAVPQAAGSNPRWRGDGKGLFFLSPKGEVMAVDVAVRGEVLEFGIPKTLFLQGVPTRFDVDRDGERFVYSAPIGGQQPGTINVVLNWRGPNAN